MKPNPALLEGLHGVSWDAQAVESRVERLLEGIRAIDPADELAMAQLVRTVDECLHKLTALVDELLEQAELADEMAYRRVAR